MIGPMLFVSIFTIEGWLRPHYSASRLVVSALSLGPRGWIQIINFVLTGCLFLVFSINLIRVGKTLKGIRTGSTLLFVLGICLVLSGLFVMDPPGTPRSLWTVHGWIHELLGAVVFMIFPISCFVFGCIFRTVLHRKIFRWWSFGIGCLLIGLIICMKTAQLQIQESFLASRLGLLQRAILISYMGWEFTLAWLFANQYHNQ